MKIAHLIAATAATGLLFVAGCSTGGGTIDATADKVTVPDRVAQQIRGDADVDCKSASQAEWMKHCAATATPPKDDFTRDVRKDAQRSITYPSGMTVTYTGTEILPDKLGSDLAKNQKLVKVTFTLSNSGDQPVRIPENGRTDLYVGANQYEAEGDPGWTDSYQKLTSGHDEPRQLVPGSSFDAYVSFDVDKDKLDTLIAEVDYDNRQSGVYTFTHLESDL